MKYKFISILIAFALLFSTCQQTQAPIVGPIVVIIIVGGTIYYIAKTQPKYYLIINESPGELRSWNCSPQMERTLDEYERRCEGPFVRLADCTVRAEINNTNPTAPIYPCGPLGNIPKPVQVSLQQSHTQGQTWANLAVTDLPSPDENWAFSLVAPTPVPLTPTEIEMIANSTIVLKSKNPKAIYRISYNDGNEAGPTYIPVCENLAEEKMDPNPEK